MLQEYTEHAEELLPHGQNICVIRVP